MRPDRNEGDAENATKQPLRCCAVDAVNCRGTVRRRAPLVRLTMVVGLLGALLSATAVANAGATTSTTLPGPAPNQSQINATQSQVSQIESTLAQEEQQTSILDDKYNTAEQNLQDAQTAMQTIAANLVHDAVDRRRGPAARGEGRGAGVRLRHARVRLRLVLLHLGHAERGAQPVHEPDRRRPDQGRGLAVAVGGAAAGAASRAAVGGKPRPKRRPRRPSRSRRPTSRKPPRRRRP